MHNQYFVVIAPFQKRCLSSHRVLRSLCCLWGQAGRWFPKGNGWAAALWFGGCLPQDEDQKSLFASGLLHHQRSAASPFLPLCLSFPLVSELGGRSCLSAVGHRVSISAGGAFPGLLLLSLIPWLGKAAFGNALQCFSSYQPGGAGWEAWGCHPAAGDAAPWGDPGSVPRVTAALGGRVVASAWRASKPPSPARQRDSLPEWQLPLGSVSKEPRRCLPMAAAGVGSLGPRPRGWAGCELPPCPGESGSSRLEQEP